MPKLPPSEPKDDRIRCAWVGESEIYRHYHDTEWGVPVYDDRLQFEFLILEGAQAGLSWLTILKKRQAYREAYQGFDPAVIAKWGKREEARLLKNPGIVRNRLKIAASITNAKAFLQVQEEFGNFCDYIWAFVGGKPIQNHWKTMDEVPVTTMQSDALSKDLKRRGFKFVGSTIIYAHMQATGMVNDHTIDCFRHQEVAAMGAQRKR